MAGTLFAERQLVCAVPAGSLASWKQRLQMGYHVIRTRWRVKPSLAREPNFVLRDDGRTAALAERDSDAQQDLRLLWQGGDAVCVL